MRGAGNSSKQGGGQSLGLEDDISKSRHGEQDGIFDSKSVCWKGFTQVVHMGGEDLSREGNRWMQWGEWGMSADVNNL